MDWIAVRVNCEDKVKVKEQLVEAEQSLEKIQKEEMLRDLCGSRSTECTLSMCLLTQRIMKTTQTAPKLEQELRSCASSSQMRCELSATALMPCCPDFCHVLCHDGHSIRSTATMLRDLCGSRSTECTLSMCLLTQRIMKTTQTAPKLEQELRSCASSSQMRCELSATALMPCCPDFCHVLCHDGHSIRSTAT
ncbi:hypothetical protein STEG23_011802, partial [Scotinomys teguina]